MCNTYIAVTINLLKPYKYFSFNRYMGVGKAIRIGHWWSENICLLPRHWRIWKRWKVKCIWWPVISKFTYVSWYRSMSSKCLKVFSFGSYSCFGRIFALATVLSSVLIYNLPETVSLSLSLSLFELCLSFLEMSILCSQKGVNIFSAWWKFMQSKFESKCSETGDFNSYFLSKGQCWHTSFLYSFRDLVFL